MSSIPRENDFFIQPVKTITDQQRFTHTWYKTWLEEGYAEDTDNIIQKYDRYNSYSDDFLLVNNKNTAVGTLRIINQNDKFKLPVLNDFIIEKAFVAKEILCEATLLTILKKERHPNHRATYILLIQIWKYVREKHIDGIVIAADIRLWLLLKRNLALCFQKIGSEMMYEGTLTVPGYLNVKEQKEFAMKSPPKNILEKAFWEI